MKKFKRILAISIMCAIVASSFTLPASANPTSYWCQTHQKTGCTHCVSHLMMSPMANSAATCTQAGGNVSICTVSSCGSVFYQNGPLGHSYNSHKVCTRDFFCGEVDGSASGWHYMFRVGNVLKTITSGYPYRNGNNGDPHSGIDITAPSGTTFDAPTYSVGSGTVYEVRDNVDGYGKLVILSIGSYKVYYGHLNSISVSENDPVTVETKVGHVGNTGSITPAPTPNDPTAGAHLHFEVRNSSGATLNPTSFYPSGVFS